MNAIRPIAASARLPDTRRMTETRITDAPNWLYLLREFYELYRFLPSGGSDKIRAHQRQVREAVGDSFATGFPRTRIQAQAITAAK